MNNNKDETSPLGLFLVKSDSKGEKLLFRFPLTADDSFECVKKSNSKYAIVINEITKKDELAKTPVGTSLPLYTELSSTTVANSTTKTASNESVATFIGIDDNTLSNLFALNPRLAGSKFELKINNVRFVSHPTQLSIGGDYVNSKKNYVIFNIVFALRANANHEIVQSYHQLSKQIAIAISSEENRCGYFGVETKKMLSTHDDTGSTQVEVSGSLYRNILEKSQLAKDLKKVYEDITSKGLVQIRFNGWIEVSFCLPQKVHRLMLKTHDFSPTISSKNIHCCLQGLRPYHTILLLAERQEILDCLPLDCSPEFRRVILMTKPFKSLLELSLDIDTTIAILFSVVSQLLFMGKATVIYPLCETNVYMIHPLAKVSDNSLLVEEFEEKFAGSESLLKLLAKFSFSISLSELLSPMDTTEQRSEQIRAIEWMLKHRLLLQLHTYVFLGPLSQSSPYITQKISQTQSDRPHSSMTTTDVDGIEFSTGSSFPSEDSLATSPANATSILHSSKSTSEDDLSSPKINSYLSAESGSILLRDIGLCQSEVDSILRVPASKHLEDLKLFARLCPYFNGRYHLEYIMYYENVRRGQLLSLIDKFRDVLYICQYEDTCVSQLCPYN